MIEYRTDPIYRKIYSVDASIFEVEPMGVAFPKNKDELLSVLKTAAENQISVIPRGAATGITGGCLGNGIIIDLSRYMNHIIEINYEEEYAICQPGVIQDQLNEALAARGYRLGPETSTGNRATLGGMVANNSAGSHSMRYGCMLDHVISVEAALAGGHLVELHSLSDEEIQKKCEKNDLEGSIYRTVMDIRTSCRDEIERHFPKIPRRVSGYNLNTLIEKKALNLSNLFVGSEGSLGIATGIKVKIVKKHQSSSVCLLHFSDMIEAMRHLEFMLSFQPIALEMIDEKIIAMARLSPTAKTKLGWLVGTPQAVFAAEFDQIDQMHADAAQHGIVHFQLKLLQQMLAPERLVQHRQAAAFQLAQVLH